MYFHVMPIPTLSCFHFSCIQVLMCLLRVAKVIGCTLLVEQFFQSGEAKVILFGKQYINGLHHVVVVMTSPPFWMY